MHKKIFALFCLLSPQLAFAMDGCETRAVPPPLAAQYQREFGSWPVVHRKPVERPFVWVNAYPTQALGAEVAVLATKIQSVSAAPVIARGTLREVPGTKGGDYTESGHHSPYLRLETKSRGIIEIHEDDVRELRANIPQTTLTAGEFGREFANWGVVDIPHEGSNVGRMQTIMLSRFPLKDRRVAIRVEPRGPHARSDLIGNVLVGVLVKSPDFESAVGYANEPERVDGELVVRMDNGQRVDINLATEVTILEMRVEHSPAAIIE